MSTVKLTPSTDGQPKAAYYSAPSKAFVLGEYGVLAGLPALVATFAPRFGLRVSKASPAGDAAGQGRKTLFHPASPAGRLFAKAEKNLSAFPAVELQFEDPYAGDGGFGGSTAQFALAYLALSQWLGTDKEWSTVWDLYRELMADAPLAPSGADLIAQWRGGVTIFDPCGVYFKVPGELPTCADVWDVFDWSSLFVFSASGQPGRKVATHEHLAHLSRLGVVTATSEREGTGPISPEEEFPEMIGLFAGLRDPLYKGLDAVRGNRHEDLGEAMELYGDELRKLGLELPQTTADRQAIGALPGVLGVKGAGAMQADAILVLMEPELAGSKRSRQRQKLVETAEARGLKLVAEGAAQQAGASAFH